MRIALIGTRGPGHYGGFETCVAEVAPRLAALDNDVTVYARSWSPARHWRHPDVRVVSLPSVRSKHLDTISHTTVSAVHARFARRPDVAIVFGVGNSPVAWLLRRAGVPVVLNVDGLDRARAKWGKYAQRYLHWAERRAPSACDVLLTDALTIQRYYRDAYGVESTFIPYGSPSGPIETHTALDTFGLQPGGYILYVSRLEPENNAHVAIAAYQRSGVELPLVIVGAATYDTRYEESLHRLAGPGVRFTGFVFGEGYAELQSHAALYLQCTEVGGTHPALVEAMGYGNAIVALDTPEHREVLGDAGHYYRDEAELAVELKRLGDDANSRRVLAASASRRAHEQYSWNVVAEAYADACHGALAHRR